MPMNILFEQEMYEFIFNVEKRCDLKMIFIYKINTTNLFIQISLSIQGNWNGVALTPIFGRLDAKPDECSSLDRL